jgi:hypothetical protein
MPWVAVKKEVKTESWTYKDAMGHKTVDSMLAQAALRYRRSVVQQHNTHQHEDPIQHPVLAHSVK